MAFTRLPLRVRYPCRTILKQTIDMIIVMGMCNDADESKLKDRTSLDAVINAPSSTSNALYVDEFETQFISRTLEYYRPLCAQWWTGDVKRYMAKVRRLSLVGWLVRPDTRVPLGSAGQ